jgi:hypothetical protein
MQCQSCTNCIPENYYKLVHTSNLHTGTILLRSSAAKVSSAFFGGWRCSEGTSDMPTRQLLQPVRELQQPTSQTPLTNFTTQPANCNTTARAQVPRHPRVVFLQVLAVLQVLSVKTKQSDATHSVHTAKQPTTCRLQQHTYTMYSLRLATLRRPCTHAACIGPSKHAGEVAHQQMHCMMSFGQSR